MKIILVFAVLVAFLSIDIFAASLNAPQVQEKQNPAEERSLGFLAFLAFWPAIKDFVSRIFSSGATY